MITLTLRLAQLGTSPLDRLLKTRASFGEIVGAGLTSGPRALITRPMASHPIERPRGLPMYSGTIALFLVAAGPAVLPSALTATADADASASILIGGLGMLPATWCGFLTFAKAYDARQSGGKPDQESAAESADCYVKLFGAMSETREAVRSQPEEEVSALACRLANYGPHQEAAWSHLPSIGIQHVFLNAPPADQVEVTRRRLAEHGLSAVVLRSDADLSLVSGVDRLAEQLATCETMGVKFLFLSVKRGEVNKAVIYERLRRGGDLARRHDVIIALETHPDLGTNGDVHRETMRQVNHPNVRINFDTGNIHFYNHGTDAPSELKKIIEYVATVEVKDHNGDFESWHFPALGKGVVNIPAVLELLREHHYEGPITMEIEGIKGVERTREAIMRDIADSAAYLRLLGEFK